MRLVLRVLQQRVLFCWSGGGGGKHGTAGSVRNQHSTGGEDVCLKVLQGPPCAARTQISSLALASMRGCEEAAADGSVHSVELHVTAWGG